MIIYAVLNVLNNTTKTREILHVLTRTLLIWTRPPFEDVTLRLGPVAPNGYFTMTDCTQGYHTSLMHGTQSHAMTTYLPRHQPTQADLEVVETALRPDNSDPRRDMINMTFGLTFLIRANLKTLCST